ncbi:MAG TPA: PAS domain-containing protein [Chitinophagales bacterium]|nr:PAS domain-containing protein [Chitinophagales bacterium]
MIQAVKASHPLFNDDNTLDIIRQMILILDPRGIILKLNQRGCEILGVAKSKRKVIGKDWFQSFVPHKKRALYRKLFGDSLVNQNLEESFEGKVLCRDGTERTIIWHASFLKNTNNSIVGMICSGEDVTEIRQYEKKLKESEENHRLLAERLKENEQRLSEAQKIATVGSWEYIPASGDIIWSDETFRLFGLKPEKRNISREEFRSYIHPDDRESLSAHVQAALQEGIPYEIEIRIIGADKRLRYLIGRGVPVMEKGKVVKLLGTGMDITQRKLDELRVKRAVVAGQDMERRRISADLHERLGQKLSGIKMFAENLAINSNSFDEDMKKLLSLLDEAVHEVKDISQKFMPPALNDFGLTNALRELCKKTSKSSGVKIKFRSYDVNGRLDPYLEFGIYRIALELLNNSLQHARAKEIHLQLFQRNNKLILTAEDDGKGFNVKKTDFNKTFGLNSVAARADALNGDFNLDSKYGKGTTASIEIPL